MSNPQFTEHCTPYCQLEPGSDELVSHDRECEDAHTIARLRSVLSCLIESAPQGHSECNDEHPCQLCLDVHTARQFLGEITNDEPAKSYAPQQLGSFGLPFTKVGEVETEHHELRVELARYKRAARPKHKGSCGTCGCPGPDAYYHGNVEVEL